MSEIIRQIREKYPAYKDVPDSDLTVAIGDKYPIYLEQDSEFAADYKRLKGTTETTTTQPPAQDQYKPELVPDYLQPSEDPRGRNPAALNPAWRPVTGPDRGPEISSLRADTTSPVGRVWQSIRESLTPLIGPTESQVFRAENYDPATGTFRYKPLGSKIESSGLIPGSFEAGPKFPRIPQQEGQAAQQLAGAYNALANLVEPMISVGGVGTLGVGSLGAGAARGAAAFFTTDMALHLDNAAKAVEEADTPQEATTAILTLAGTVALIGKGAETTIKGVPAPLNTAAVKAEAAGAPATAAALKAQEQIIPVSEPKGIAASAREALAGQPVGSEAGAVAVPEWLKTAGEWIRPRDAATPPEMRLDESNVLPRLQSYETEKLTASQPRGVGAVPVFGKLLDPRARAYGPVEQAVIGHAASKAKGDTIGALWAEANSVTRPKSLIADEAGTIALADGSRGYLSDVIEAEMRQPGSQSLLPEQRRWIEEVWKPLNNDLKTMLAGENVRGFETGEGGIIDVREDYFPRPAIGKRDVEGTKAPTGGSSVGGRQFFQKERLYETEAEGAQTTIYEPDPVKRVATLISRAYKAVADTRLANDQTLGGQTVAERFDAIKAERGGVLEGMSEPERLATLREWRDEAAHPLFMKEGTVDQPAFRDKIFPLETAQKLQKHYADYSQSWLGKLSNVSRAFQLTLDMSAPFNQGLVLMYRNPKAWGKGVAESWKALFDGERMGKYLQEPENAAAARELSQLGVSLRRMQDFVSGQTPDNIPGIKQTGRAFGVFMDVAKIEHWKAIREVYPKEQWPALAEALDNSLLSGRIEQTGITPRSAHYERLALLAASYYRGGIGLVSTALQRGAGGMEARKALAAFAVGVTATSVAGMLAAGLTWDEIADRLNPSKGKFMRVPVTIGDRKIEAGFGNILLSFSRLLGETVEAANSDSPIRSGAENNPWIRWTRAKLGPVPAFGTDVAVGRDIMGKEIGIAKAAANRFTPITVQQGTGEGTASGKGVDAALSFLGLQAYPQNVRELFSTERERIAQEQHGKSYESLSIREQATISRALEKEERFKRPESTARQREMAYQADIDRINRIKAGLSKEAQGKLDALGVKLTGYEATIPAGNKPLALTRNQTERYEKLIVEEYERILGRIDTDRFSKLDTKQRQKRVNDLLLAAKHRARSRLVSEQGK